MSKARWVMTPLIAVTLALAVLLRFLDLGQNPPGFWQDEVSTALDALSLFRTGRDRTGAFLPLICRSFGDYPLALYRYLAAPLVGLFGPTIAHERWVAAGAGSLAVLGTFLWARRALGISAALGALISAAFAPTWLHFSRYGSEAILLPASLIWALWLFERGKAPGNRASLWVGALVAALSAYTYHAVKVVLPLWTLLVLWYLRGTILTLWRTEQRRHVLGPMILFSLTVFPSAWLATTSDGMARGRDVLAWHVHSNFGPLEIARLVLSNYLSYFDPGVLFVRGGAYVAQSVPNLGLWNLIDLPLMLFGFAGLARGHWPKEQAILILGWFLLGPVAGALTYETQNVGRAIAWLPAPQLISGLGFAELLGLIARQRPRLRFALYAFLSSAWVFTFANVYFLNLVRYPKISERDWQREISGAILCALERRQEGEQIVVSPHFPFARVFGGYLLGALPEGTVHYETREVVAPGELYVWPVGQAAPAGREVCRIAFLADGVPRAYVYAAKP